MTAMKEQELREKLNNRFESVCAEGHQKSCGEYQTAVDDVMQLITQYGDTREREGREWHKINVSDESTYPPFDTPVLARMAYDNKKFEPIYIVVKHVDEDDCSWRTSDGDELSYWVNVTHWQVIAELKEEV